MAKVCLCGSREFTGRLLQEGRAGGDLALEAAPFAEAAARLESGECEALVAQWDPGRDDPAALRALAGGVTGPVLIIAPSADSEVVVPLLEAGVSDVLPPGLSPREVLSHLRSLLGRNASESTSTPLANLQAGNVSLDPARHEVLVDGRPLSLPPREYDLLAELLARAGQVCARRDLTGRVWGDAVPPHSRTVDVHVGRLRLHLNEAGASGVSIATLPGVGYRLEALA